MCNVNCIVFGAINLNEEEIEGKNILEVGSYVINGGLRPIVESWKPAKYVGVDIEKGLGVDVVCNAEELLDKFEKNSFDIVLSTELLEHVKDWRKAISNIKNICKPNGIILITTRSYGFGYHAYPFDFWRYELEDMEKIFSDCEILVLEKDPAKGVFIKVKKPNNFIENDLSNYELYSIVANKRVKQIADNDFRSLYFRRLVLREKLKSISRKFRKNILGVI